MHWSGRLCQAMAVPCSLHPHVWHDGDWLSPDFLVLLASVIPWNRATTIHRGVQMVLFWPVQKAGDPSQLLHFLSRGWPAGQISLYHFQGILGLLQKLSFWSGGKKIKSLPLLVGKKTTKQNQPFESIFNQHDIAFRESLHFFKAFKHLREFNWQSFAETFP